MNILHISRRFCPLVGGTEKYIYEVASRLVKRGFNCKVLTLNYDIFNKSKKLKNYEIIDGIEVHRVSGFGYYKKPIPLGLPLSLFKWSDIVHLHDVRFLFETTVFLKKFFKYKLVLSTHGFILHTKDFEVFKNLLIPLYYKPVIKDFFDAVICVSKQDYKFFQFVDKRKLFLVENGIDFEKFNRIKRSPKKGKLLYFGRIDTNKGLEQLFEVLTLLKGLDWQLDIVGSGFKEYVEKLKELACQLGISEKIFWYGFVDEKKLLDFLSEAEICFFPSLYEGFGFTLVEAMACGCVCVANNIESYKDILEDNKEGFLVDFKNKQAVAELMLSITKKTTKELNEISQNAKQKAKSFDWEKKIEEIAKIYQQWKNLDLQG